MFSGTRIYRNLQCNFYIVAVEANMLKETGGGWQFPVGK